MHVGQWEENDEEQDAEEDNEDHDEAEHAGQDNPLLEPESPVHEGGDGLNLEEEIHDKQIVDLKEEECESEHDNLISLETESEETNAYRHLIPRFTGLASSSRKRKHVSPPLTSSSILPPTFQQQQDDTDEEYVHDSLLKKRTTRMRVHQIDSDIEKDPELLKLFGDINVITNIDEYSGLVIQEFESAERLSILMPMATYLKALPIVQKNVTKIQHILMQLNQLLNLNKHRLLLTVYHPQLREIHLYQLKNCLQGQEEGKKEKVGLREWMTKRKVAKIKLMRLGQ
ncbi:hypothetical protein L1987_04057 [Smallanthus sonchifolius]|uniref:Uncharacterized protein n=1 Tax=Smallanthus sonchifolius TaxID=185202 RepID=A0ACB9KCM8_9ASTR|nr:hypothetical protein L1987_04057 [Smallanthus sonchifolius]